MDGNRFDDLSRKLASRMSRRSAVKGITAGLLGALGLREAAEADITQVYCGNTFCETDPGKCKPGCVCCTYYNPIVGRIINSRCQPPQFCHPNNVVCPSGKVYDPQRGCVDAQSTTTAAPTTTTTTARPTTTTTTTAHPTTTTTTPPPCGGTCSPDQVCCNGECKECCTEADCNDGIDCTDDYCVDGVCQNIPVDFLCGSPRHACELFTCDPARGGCVHEERICPGGNFDCVRGACDPGQGCFRVQDHDSCPSDNFCDVPFCSFTEGCTTVTRNCTTAQNPACVNEYCDPVDQVCKAEPDHDFCPPHPTLYNCMVPFCTGGIRGGCGYQSLCTTANQNGCGPIDRDHGCACLDAFVTGGSCVTSGPQ